MKTKSFRAVLIAVFAALYLFCPADTPAQKNKTETQIPDSEMLRKYKITGDFYDRLQAQETGWEFSGFFLSPLKDTPEKTFGLDFQKEDKQVRVYIYEYETAAQAAKFSVLNIHISGGRVEEYKRYGDEGKKVYGDNEFSSLSFRKNRFVVSIYCVDEKTAERFAGYFSDVINS
jgi:hypothetical protein